MCRALWNVDISEVCGDRTVQTLVGEEGDLILSGG